jgi:hypothetical protein
MSATKTPTMPTGLGTKAQKLWKSLTTEFELRSDELRILEDACREVDLVERLEKEIKKKDFKLVVRGSMGQPVASPLIQEIRQHRAITKSLLAGLKLPDEPDSPASQNRSASARKAANARWRMGGA